MNPVKNKLTFKEKREMEELERTLEAYAAEKRDLEEKLNSGTLSPEAIGEAGKRLMALAEENDIAELRYLELLEKSE